MRELRVSASSAEFQGSNSKYLFPVCTVTETQKHMEALTSSPDPELYGRCRTEFTRNHLDSSAIAVHTSKDKSHPCCPPSVKSMKWTERQHSSYLNYLETSFVKHLPHLLVIRGRHSQYHLRETHFKRRFPDQYLVLPDSCWQKISLERTELMLESTADSHVSVGSPSRPHLTTAERESDAYNPGFLVDVNLARNPKSSCRIQSAEKRGLCQPWHSYVAEVSDQNFEDRNQGAKSKAKKVKTALDDSSSNDQLQVVPFGKFHGTDISTGSSSSSGNELVSEQTENFFFPRYDEHYFHRGS